MTRSAASKKYEVPTTTLFIFLGNLLVLGQYHQLSCHMQKKESWLLHYSFYKAYWFWHDKRSCWCGHLRLFEGSTSTSKPVYWIILAMTGGVSSWSDGVLSSVYTNRSICLPVVPLQWLSRPSTAGLISVSVLKEIGLADLSQYVLEQHIWNCDDTGFCTAQASKKVIAKRGKRDVHDTMGGIGREFFTVLAAECASGVWLPPYFVYNGKRPLE